MRLYIKDVHKKILFHIALWGIWLYLTLINTTDEQYFDKFVLMVVLILSTHIPLFIFNTEWLIPKVFLKKGTTAYIGSLLLAIVVFAFLHYFFLHIVTDLLGMVHTKALKPVKGVIALVLVAAISTGYGLLQFIVQQEQVQQEKQKERLQSELSFLRSQISPHFIFNILNSIVYLIRTQSALAETITIKLSELMRYMLYESENEHIRLEKEISYVETYIDLQKIRFEDDVAIRYSKEGSPGHRLIEPMLLIPFVENAFKHGTALVRDPEIEVRLNMEQDHLRFKVRNKISSETADNKDSSSGIGLRNVRRRLELLYPNKHQLHIAQDGGWFTAKLYIYF